jgi:hypothetical protein
MPSLDEWLEAWVKVAQNPGTPLPMRFRCYNPINMQSTYTKFEPGNTSKAALSDRYDVIGDQSQMDKTVCVMALRYTGFFPSQCNCTSPKRRILLAAMDHGVTHHGDTFNLTKHQEEAITLLTGKDMLLYSMAREVFAEQVQEIENEFQVTLCDKIKDDSV